MGAGSTGPLSRYQPDLLVLTVGMTFVIWIFTCLTSSRDLETSLSKIAEIG